MAKIDQGNTYKTVVGWYGECGGDECQDINLSVYKTHVAGVFQWDTNGVLKGWSKNLPDAWTQPFTKLECGKLYYLVILPGTSSFTIPNFVVSSFETVDAGRLVSSCEATPTPIVCTCAPEDFVVTTISSTSHTFADHILAGFATGTEVSFNDSTLVTAGIACTVALKFPGGSPAGFVVLQKMQPNNTQFYVKHGITCYTAIASASNGSGDSWELEMSSSEQLPDTCGDNIELPTPEPEPTPTPEPEPTPTPQPPSDCCPDPQTQVDTIGGVNLREVFHTYPSGMQVALLKYQGYDSGGTLCADLTLTDGWTEEGTESTKLVLLPGSSDPIGTITKTLKNGTDKNTFYYIDSQQTCYVGDYNDDSPIELVTTTGTATKQTPTPEPEPTPTPEPEPTPTPEPEPEPTPTPQPPSADVPSDCCPDPQTQVDTIGGVNLREVFHTYPSGMQVALLKYQGYDSGGTLCADLTLTDGWTEEGTESTKLVLLPGSSDPIGTITKTLKNGTDKNTFYYIDSQQTCYVGDYNDDSPIELVTTTGTASETTPTPEPDPTPTPTPEKTPTPVPDTAAPTATVSGAPTSAIYPEIDVNLTIGGTDVTHYKHKLESGNWSAETPVATALTITATWSIGTHTVKVVAKDAAGNWQTEGNATTVTFQVIAVPSTELDCECTPEGLSTISASGSMFRHLGHTFGNWKQNEQIGFDDSTLKSEGIASTAFFTYPDDSQAGIIVFTGKKPNNTKFYVRTGKYCYTVVGQASPSSVWNLKLSLETTLPDGCDSDGGNFAAETTCCSDSSVAIQVFAGSTDSEYGVGVTAYPDGNMDGELCFNPPTGWPDDIDFQFPYAKMFMLEGLTDETQLIKIDTTIPPANLYGMQFIYRLASGDCYQGYFQESGTSTFNLV